MRTRDYRDVVSGVLLICFGAFVIYYSARYELGTFRRMGPGMFPTLLGYSLCLVGGLILVPAFFRSATETVTIEYRSFIFVIGALVSFALTVPHFGIAPAIVVMTIVSSFADGRLRPISVLMLAVVLATIGVVLFHNILGTALAPFKWPF